jgi:iron complex transport system ATP-binding protein
MIARVLATEPRWILADEPLAALDIAHRHEVMHLLAGVAAQGIGVVIVLHDLALARRMADTVLLLHKGRLVVSGKAGEVLCPDVLSPVFGVPFELLRGADGSETLVASPPLSSRP